MNNLKEQIKAAANTARSKVHPVTAWGVPCTIRVMSGTERDAWESEIFDGGKMNKDKFRARLLVLTLADDQGKRVFDGSDIAALSDSDSVELDRLYTIAAKVNGLTKDDVDALVKN